MTPAPALALPAPRQEHRLLDRAAEAADRLSESLAEPPPSRLGDDDGPRSRRWWDQSLSKGAAGVAVLHGVRARDGHARPDLAHSWLTRAGRENISAAPGSGLWFGAPAVAFAVHIAAPGRYPAAAAALHAAVECLVARRLQAAADRLGAAGRPSLSEFDLVRGLTGLGAYLLCRDPDDDLLRRVLAYLVRLTEPLPVDDEAGHDAPGWWTRDVPSGSDVDEFGEGHADLGMAHGISGPLALLALAMRRGTTVPGHAEAIERICAWLDTWRRESAGGAWWPQRLTLAEVRGGISTQTGPRRSSWCYGTPGLARAQQLAGLALGDTHRQDTAEQALLQAVTDPAQLGQITDPGMCHGWAGVVATVWCAAQDARTPDLPAHLRRLVDTLVTQAAVLAPETPAGLIDGTAGVALTLHGLATRTIGSWASCLLLT